MGSGTGPVRPGVAAEPVAPARSSLLVGDLSSVSQVHKPRSATVRVGRAPDNDIVIEDLTVSWHHAELRGDAATGFELADLGSFNGTFVNGVQTERARVQDGDVISIGHHRLHLIGGTLEEYVDTGDIRFEVSGLTVRLPNGTTLIDDVDFSLDQRNLMAVVGPSGAGKSTLLNALTGFRPAQEGTVLYDGRDLYASYADLRQRIGYVPQDDILHTELTVRKALEYAARLRFPPDVDPHQRTERITEVIDEMGLGARANVAISRLSGGQRKRASVAIELLTKPSLLFLDEPTSGLDPGYERTLTELLRELADGGRTIVVVTHSVQSLDLCDRIIFLAPGGRTAYFGPPNDAPQYFEAETYARIFGMLEEGADQDWTAKFQQTAAYRRYVAEPLEQRDLSEAAALPARSDAAPPRRQGWWRQFITLTRRYLSVIGSDRKVVLALALQAPILGLLMLAALPTGELRPLGPSELARLSAATSVLAVLVIGVTGLGISNSIREIVKETAVYRRERAVGLSITAYVMSKAAVLSLITGAQAAVLVLIGIQRQGGGWGSALFEPAQLELAAGFVMAGLAAMALGLLVSAISSNADRAISLLPVLLILQLIVSGAFKDVLEKPILREISYVSSAQWGFSAGAATIDLNELQAFNDCLSADLSLGSQKDIEELLGCSVLERVNDSDESLAQLEDTLVDAGLSRAEASELIREAQASQDDVPRVAMDDEPPLRFWDQTPADWLTNMGILTGMTLIGIFGSVWALRRRDPDVLSGG